MLFRALTAPLALLLGMTLASGQTLDLPPRAVNALSRDAILTLITPSRAKRGRTHFSGSSRQGTSRDSCGHLFR